MTPNVNIVVRMPTAAPQQSGDSSADKVYQRLTHTLAGQSRGEVGLHQNPPASRGVGEGGPAATLAAAKQAVAVLGQQWQRQEQRCGVSGVRRAKRKQRYGRLCLPNLHDTAVRLLSEWASSQHVVNKTVAEAANMQKSCLNC